MYSREAKKTKKKMNRFTTDLDDWQAEAASEVILLAGIDKAKFVRQAIMNEIESFHKENSIGREPKQQSFLNVRKWA